MRSFFITLLLVFSIAPVFAENVQLEPVDVVIKLGESNVDLSLGKRVLDYTEASLEKGAIVTIELVYHNQGKTPATMVVIEDYYGRDRFLEAVTVPTGCIDDKQKMVCSLGTLAAGQSGSIRYQARVSHFALLGEHIASGTISSREEDSNLQNNTSRIIFTVKDAPSRQAIILRADPNPKTIQDIKNMRTSSPSPVASISPTPSVKPTSSPTPTPSVSKNPATKAKLTIDFLNKTTVIRQDGEDSLIVNITNPNALAQTDVVVAITFPFETLDLLSTNQAYSYRESAHELTFKKATLAPGERWMIRLTARPQTGKFFTTADIAATAASAESQTRVATNAKIVFDKNSVVTPPVPSQNTEQYIELPQTMVGAGAPLFFTVLASLLGALCFHLGIFSRRQKNASL